MNTRARILAPAAAASMLAMPIAGSLGRVSAQQATPAAALSAGAIEVYAEGAVMIEPDAASIVIGVDVQRPNLTEAQAKADETMVAVIAAIEEAGIAEDRIQTVFYNVSVINEYDQNGQIKGVIGYQVNHQVSVLTEDLAGLGALIDQVVQQGANSIYGITFLAMDSTAAASQARVRAVEIARTRAEELAAAAAVGLGQIIRIQEVSSPIAPAVRSEAAYDMAGSAPIQTGSLTISVGISMTWAIDQ